MAGFYFSIFLCLINQGFTSNLSLILYYFHYDTDSLNLNSQLPLYQHLETPQKCLHAASEEIGLVRELIIITVGWLLVAHSIPYTLFLEYRDSHAFRTSISFVSRKEIIFEFSSCCVLSPPLTKTIITSVIASTCTTYGNVEHGMFLNCVTQRKQKQRPFHKPDIKAAAIVLVVVGLCPMSLGMSWSRRARPKSVQLFFMLLS